MIRHLEKPEGAFAERKRVVIYFPCGERGPVFEHDVPMRSAVTYMMEYDKPAVR